MPRLVQNIESSIETYIYNMRIILSSIAANQQGREGDIDQVALEAHLWPEVPSGG
jgi:hypothetical protein